MSNIHRKSNDNLRAGLWNEVMKSFDVDVFQQSFIFPSAFDRLHCHFQREMGTIWMGV